MRNLYIWPSREGLVFLIGLLAIFLCAVNFNNALIYALSFLLAGMFLVCMLHTYTNLYGLGLEVYAGRPVYRGGDAGFRVRVHSPAGSRGLVLSVPGWPRAASAALRLAPGIETHLDLFVPADRRGWLRLHTVCLESRYPAGLLRAWAHVPTEARCLVYPRPLSHSRRRPAHRAIPEEHETGAPPQPQPGASDFQGFRAYLPGDPPRSISWKSLRGETLLIHRFSDHEHACLVLDWDSLADVRDDEERLSQLCSWVLQAARARAAYALRLPARSIPAGAGSAHKSACLEALALHGQAG